MEIESGYLHIAQASIMKNKRKIITHLIIGFIIMGIFGALRDASVLFFPFAIIIGLLIYDIIDAKSYKFIFYTDKVIVLRGVFTKHQDQVFLSKVLAVRYSQTAIGKIFNYGDVFIDQLGDNDFWCQCITSPQKLVEAMSPLVTRPSSRIF